MRLIRFCFGVSSTRVGGSDVGPDRLRDVGDEAEFLHDVVLADGVPVRVGRETALGADADPASRRNPVSDTESPSTGL